MSEIDFCTIFIESIRVYIFYPFKRFKVIQIDSKVVQIDSKLTQMQSKVIQITLKMFIFKVLEFHNFPYVLANNKAKMEYLLKQTLWGKF